MLMDVRCVLIGLTPFQTPRLEMPEDNIGCDWTLQFEATVLWYRHKANDRTPL